MSIPSSEITLHNAQTESTTLSEREQALIYRELNVIANAYKIFAKTKEINFNYLQQATLSLSQVKTIEQTYWQKENIAIALALQALIKPYEMNVQEMNFHCPYFTSQDMQNIASFYAPPKETVFHGEQDGLYYVNPDSSAPARFGIQILMETGLYESTGVAKRKFGSHPVTHKKQYYDEFYLVKPKGRANYDARQLSVNTDTSYSISNIWRTFRNFISSREPTEEEKEKLDLAVSKCVEIFSQNCHQWGYDSFFLQNTEVLHKQGEDLQKASQCDVVKFYYKKASKHEQSN